jgi:hypothetical protein
MSLFQDVIVNANELQAFYVTMMATSSYLYYGANKTSDNAQSIIAQNDDLVISPGSANYYLFGKVLTPRFWNGVITYHKTFTLF